MKILAIETSSAAAGAAVAEDGTIVAARSFGAPRGRGAELFTVLEDLRPQWGGLQRLAVGIGPGSYNGLRAACALAGSFQQALGIEVVVLPSPCLLDTDEHEYTACGDARGGRLWVARVRGRALVGNIELVPLENLPDQHGPLYRVGMIPGLENVPEHTPSASVLAAVAPGLTPCEPAQIAPLYLKPPHITKPRGTAA